MENIEKQIEYSFKNKKLLKQSLTHPSIEKQSMMGMDYETLEFLGDSVLNLVITEFLIEHYKEEDEGSLAKRRAGLISGDIVSEVAISIGLGNSIFMAQGEEATGGRVNRNNLEDAMEALIGAVYLDSDYETIKNIIRKFWIPISKKMIVAPSNPKTALQEWSQSEYKIIPEYVVISSSGPPHSPIFEIEVKVEGYGMATASGNSKKKAEIRAAELLLEKIKKSRNYE